MIEIQCIASIALLQESIDLECKLAVGRDGQGAVPVFVGVGEQSGTGIPKILHGWQWQHWRPPKLYDTSEPYNQTLIELRMTDLFPTVVMAGLKTRFGERFEGLSYVERVALALAASEGTVNHASAPYPGGNA